MLEWIVQGGGGVTIPVGVKEKTACGTESHGCVDKLVFAHSFGLKGLFQPN